MSAEVEEPEPCCGKVVVDSGGDSPDPCVGPDWIAPEAEVT